LFSNLHQFQYRYRVMGANVKRQRSHLTVGALLMVLGSCVAAADSGLLDRVAGTPDAPAFELNGPNGNRYRLSDLRGKSLIVNFWATWCPPCRAEMPSMQRAWEQLRDEDVVVIGINVGEDKAAIEAFTEQVPVDFPLPMDIDSEVVQRWPVRGLPTTFVVDPEGRLVYIAQGEREWDDPDLLDSVRALNNGSASSE
jgi:peroxiredoxin